MSQSYSPLYSAVELGDNTHRWSR